MSRIVALGLALAAVFATPALARPSEHVAVLVVPASSAVFSSPRAAHGLAVVGEGATVTRRGALASLLTGDVGNAVLHGGVPNELHKISLARAPARTTFYVSLPPPGRHHNVVRYPIAVVGPGYHGLLTSSGTHLDGLVAIWDVAPSVLALSRGEKPRIRSRPSSAPLAYLARFDGRLTRAHDARLGATIVLLSAMVGFGVGAFFTRSRILGRTAFLAAPSCLVLSLVLSAAGVTDPTTLTVVLAVGGPALALAGGLVLRRRLPLALALGALFVFVFAALWADPLWNSLASLGARPDGGGRFYGINNQVATMLLSPALVLGALAGPVALPGVALVIAFGVAASGIGANSDGILTFLVGFIVLGLRLGPTRPGFLRVAGAVAVAAAAALALVGIDAAFGGSSHITHAVGGGPGTLWSDFTHRLHLSAAYVGSGWNAALWFAVSITGLAWLALRRPRVPVLDALLVALVVSLLVNDSPTDIAGLGALSALALWAWLGRSGEHLDALD